VKHLLTTFVALVAALCGSVSAQSNLVKFVYYTPGEVKWNWVQHPSVYTNYVGPITLDGLKWRSASNISTVLLVSEDLGHTWLRVPYVFRHPSFVYDGVWLSVFMPPIRTDKPTFYRVEQFPEIGSGLDMAYVDAHGRFTFVTNSATPSVMRLPEASWMTNRLYVCGTNSTGGRIFCSGLPIDEHSMEGATDPRYASLTKPGYWIIPTNPPPVVVTNIPPPTPDPITIGTVITIGTNIYVMKVVTNSDGSRVTLGRPVGTTGSGSDPGTGAGDGSGTPIPPDPNNNPTVPPAPVRVTAALGAITDSSFSTAGFAAFRDAMMGSPSPKYQSSGLETNEWAGAIVVPTNGPVALYVRSDDGCTVTINGGVVLDGFGSGQNWAKPERSLFDLGCLPAGSSNWVKVRYSNIVHGSGDVDGISLYTVGDYDQARVSGPPAIPFFGSDGSAEQVFKYNGHGSVYIWSVSPNLRIVATNDQFKFIRVVATGASSSYWDTWVEAWGASECGGYSTKRFYLTVVKPTALLNAGLTRTTGTIVSSVYSYQIMDQFGAPFTFPCFATEATWAMQGTPTPGTYIRPDSRNVSVTGGRFIDTLAAQRSSWSFVRGQGIFAHRLIDGSGVLIRLNRVDFFGNSIDQITAFPAGQNGNP
jgi:hypothetical protein